MMLAGHHVHPLAPIARDLTCIVCGLGCSTPEHHRETWRDAGHHPIVVEELEATPVPHLPSDAPGGFVTELALAWLVCFHRALVTGATLGLALSLASVLSELPATYPDRLDPNPAQLAQRGEPATGSTVVGSSVRAGFSYGGQAGGAISDGPARTTPRALPVPRGQPLTVETSRDPATLVTLAAYEFGVDPAWMLRVMDCESRGDPEAIGDGGLAVGIFQWHGLTWRQYAPTLAYSMTDYGGVEAQARLTAWAFAHGHAGLWSCAR